MAPDLHRVAPWMSAAVLAVLASVLVGAGVASRELRLAWWWDLLIGTTIVGGLAAHVYLLSGGRGAWRVARAVFARGWQALVSYRFQLVMLLVQLVVFAALVIGLGAPVLRIVFGPIGAALGAYTRTNYVVFLMLGIALFPVLWSSFQVTSQRLRQEQMTGMFEALAVTPAGARTLPFAYLLSSLGASLGAFFALLLVFKLLLPPEGTLAVTEPRALLAFASILAPAVVTMWGLGLMMGGLTALFKQAQQAATTLRVIMVVFAGLYIPLALMPPWAFVLSRALPASYAGEGARGALAEGLHLSEMWLELFVLMAFALVTSLAGMWVYRTLLDRARRAGTLYGY